MRFQAFNFAQLSMKVKTMVTPSAAGAISHDGVKDLRELGGG